MFNTSAWFLSRAFCNYNSIKLLLTYCLQPSLQKGVHAGHQPLTSQPLCQTHTHNTHTHTYTQYQTVLFVVLNTRRTSTRACILPAQMCASNSNTID